jgi:hypothetical protein
VRRRGSARRVVTGAVAAALLAGAFSAGAAHGQVGASQPGTVHAGAGIMFEGYSFSAAGDVDLDRISLLTVPVSVRAVLMRQLELAVTGGYARGTLTRSYGDAVTLAGPIDTEVRLTWSTPRDRVRVSGIAQLPTGSAELSAAEMDLAGVIAADLLPFAISNWGTGGGVGISAAAAMPVGAGTTLGASAGYVVAREYAPLDATSFAYRPGNQFQVRVALDHSVGASGKASIQLSYQQFGSDRVEGDNLYQAGDRLQAMGSYAFAAAGSGSGVVYAGYQRREAGEYTTATRLVPAQDLIFGGLGLRLPAAGVVMTPSLDARIVGNEDGIDQGYTVRVGTGAEFDLGAAVVVPSARVRFGHLTVSEGAESGFTGFDLGVTLRGTRRLP